MRLTTILTVATLALWLTSATNVTARVLLPDDTAADSAAPNLGLVPTQPTTKTETTTTTATPSAPTTSNAPANVRPSEVVQQHLSQEMINKAVAAKIGNGLNVGTEEYQHERAAQMARREALRQNSFRQDTPDSAPDDMYLNDLNSVISVRVAPSYMWGGKDVRRLGRVLGLKPQEVSATCALRLSTTLTGSEGRSYRLSIYAGQEGQIKYKGTPSSIEFSPYAVCRKPAAALPNTGEEIAIAGDNYVVMLMKAAQCPVRGTPNGIFMQYGGDGTATCKPL
jgi:hypothetical protein